MLLRLLPMKKLGKEDLGGAEAHATKSGVCSMATEDDEDCLSKIRELIS